MISKEMNAGYTKTIALAVKLYKRQTRDQGGKGQEMVRKFKLTFILNRMYAQYSEYAPVRIKVKVETYFIHPVLIYSALQPIIAIASNPTFSCRPAVIQRV